jgi:hypothetical protein
MNNTNQNSNQETKQGLNFSEVVAGLLSILGPREQDVIKRRYELTEKDRETLEEIGQSYKITRERVRQIEVDGIKRLQKIDLNDGKFISIRSVEQEINRLLRAHGGIMEENYLLDELLKVFGNNVLNRKSINFIIGQLLSDKFSYIKESDDFYGVWKLNNVSWDFISNILIQIINILKRENKPLKSEEILNLYKSEYRALGPEKDIISYLSELKLDVDSVILSYLKISQYVKQNILGEWGLIDWNVIMPKRMSDKIYLILKQEKKPLHYIEVAKLINDAVFDKKVAQPATVHNELIMDKKYILVGRGIYGLEEWGYMAGTVTEIIEAILKASGSMQKDDLIQKVLEQRMVRKTTIILSLSNKEKFSKLPTGEFQLANA